MVRIPDLPKKSISAALAHFLRAVILYRYKNSPIKRSFDSVTIVAPLGWENGISIGAKYQFDALIEAGINVSILDATNCIKNPFSTLDHQPSSLYILHCGGPQTSKLLWSIMPHALDAYKIAYWAWELPDPAPDWKGYDALVDEIWTPSEFSKASIAKMSDKPVHVVPHFIKPQPSRRKRSSKQFKVLVMADSRSSFSRKNPAGAINAFRKAFGSSTLSHLYIKLSGRSEDISLFKKKMNIEDSSNITVITNKLTASEVISLLQSVDVLMSLHRSEGFGLPILEAMSCGTPVIATAWSGSTDFLQGSNGFLVDYELIPVKDQYSIYKGSVWAEPDLEMAASMLIELSQNPDLLNKMSEAAYEYVINSRPNFPI